MKKVKSLRDGEKINLFSFDFAFCAKTRNTWTRRAQKGKSSEKENRFISVKLPEIARHLNREFTLEAALRKAYEAAIQQGYCWHEFGDL